MQTATCNLKAEFVKGAVVHNGVMLKSDVEVAGLIQPGARAGVLTKDLILRSGLDSGDQRGRNTDAQERSISIVPTLIESAGPEAGFL